MSFGKNAASVQQVATISFFNGAAPVRRYGVTSLSYLTNGGHGRLSKRNESPPVLISQSQPYTPQTLEQGESSDGSELRMIPQHIWQPIRKEFDCIGDRCGGHESPLTSGAS
jgi:hypothetical protein